MSYHRGGVVVVVGGEGDHGGGVYRMAVHPTPPPPVTSWKGDEFIRLGPHSHVAITDDDDDPLSSLSVVVSHVLRLLLFAPLRDALVPLSAVHS